MALSVVTAIALLAALPGEVRPGPRWLLAFMGLILVALIVADPGRIDGSTTIERVLSIALLALLIMSSAVATVLLVRELIVGGGITDSAVRLLLVGNAVWFTNNIVFSLLYWEGDSGGSGHRARHPSAHRDLAFPQHMSPGIASPDWRPVFIDYLYLGFTNALAFSPTDTMPLVPWTKIAMTVQSLISVAILGLVIARAANILK